MRADCYPDLSQLVAVNGTLLVGATALLSYVLAPAALLYAVLGLWEHYCTNLRDLTNCLPLPPGRMGLPVVGEMFHFFILVSTLSFLFCFSFVVEEPEAELFMPGNSLSAVRAAGAE